MQISAGFSSTSSGNEPVQDGVEVGFFFGTDTIAAYFAMGDGFQIHCLDDLIDGQLVGKIRLVSEDQKRDTVQRGLFHEVMKLFCRYWECRAVCCVHDIAACVLVSMTGGGRLIKTRTQSYTIALTPRQYRSHIGRNRGCPPRSQLRGDISAAVLS
jgi:hypothetical protein